MKTFRKRGFYTPVAALYGSGAAPWTPASLGSALIAWYKADAGVYSDAGTTLATNGQAVQQWNDQSGHGFHLVQPNSGVRPVFTTGALNSLPALTFDGSIGQAVATSGEPITLGIQTLSAFAVVKVTGNPGNARIVGISNASVGGDIDSTTAILLCLLGSTLVTVTAYNNGSKGTATITSGSWNQLASIFDSANSNVYVGNVSGGAVAASPTFASTVDLEVGGTVTANSGITGQVAEVFFANTALNSTDRGHAQTYFFGRWGV
jgi:hypothetical protein